MLTATDYYPFGMEMPGRKYNPQNYRYGFNGKENDRSGEWGLGLVQDYGFRLYNPGLGRFLSVDPLSASFPSESSYIFAGNSPIQLIDLEGGFKFKPGEEARYRKQYPNVMAYFDKVFLNTVMNSEKTKRILLKYSVGTLTETQIKKDAMPGNGPTIEFVPNVFYGGNTCYPSSFNSKNSGDGVRILLNEDNIAKYENILKDNTSAIGIKTNALQELHNTFLNEYIQYGDALDEWDAIKNPSNTSDIINNMGQFCNIGGTFYCDVNGVIKDYGSGCGTFDPKPDDEGNIGTGELFGAGPAKSQVMSVKFGRNPNNTSEKYMDYYDPTVIPDASCFPMPTQSKSQSKSKK